MDSTPNKPCGLSRRTIAATVVPAAPMPVSSNVSCRMILPKLSTLVLATLVIAQTCPAQADNTCPRTLGSETAFRGPWPAAATWYGTEALAVKLPKDGIWPTTKPGNRISVKVFWYSTEFQATAEKGFDGGEHMGFEARIRRLGPGPNDAVISGPNWVGLGGLGENWTILTGIDFPSAGCWELTGEYFDQSLTFVVETIDRIEWRNRFESATYLSAADGQRQSVMPLAFAKATPPCLWR